MLTNKVRVHFLLIFIFILLSSDLPAQDFNGNYELSGVMEMAGQLKLLPQNKYVATFSYGAADWSEIGIWKPEGNGLTLLNGQFKNRNTSDLSLFLPSGLHFEYKDGKLIAHHPAGKISFIDPTKTPSKSGQPGEGRMRVQGTVMKLTNEELVIKIKNECVSFNAQSIDPKALKNFKVGKKVDTEIPFSAILSGGSC